jgi:hypothetical protein
MPDGNTASGSQTEVATRTVVSPSDLVELYKHHFDLFLKGYGLQLAVLAAVAGFAFSDSATLGQRTALLVFGAVVCIVCAIAWNLGMRWQTQLSVTLGAQCGDPKLGSVVTSLSKSILPLAFWSSLITSAACITCAVIPPPMPLKHASGCACSLVRPLDDSEPQLRPGSIPGDE